MARFQITSILITLFACVTFTACTNSSTKDVIQPAANILGPGWVCYSSPDEFIKAGVVYELKDGIPFFEDDFSDRANFGLSKIGQIEFTDDTTYGGVLKLLKETKILKEGDGITAQLNTKASMNIAYGSTKKYVLNGDSVRSITAVMSVRPLNPASKYILIRESQAAKNISVSINRKVFTEIGINANLFKLIETNPKVSRDGTDAYKIEDSFESPIGVCAKSYEIIVTDGLDGRKGITLSDAPYIEKVDDHIRKRK